MADFETETFSKRRTLIELQNFKLTENPPFFIHAVSGWAFTKIDKMTYEIKRLKKEMKEWKSQEVKERFERVNSQLHLVAINEIEHKIKRLKRGEDI